MKYRQIESMDELKVIDESSFYFWKVNLESDSHPMILTILKNSQHTPTGWWAGPIATPEQMTEAEKMLYAMVELKGDLAGLIVANQAVVDTAKYLQKQLDKAPELEFKKYPDEAFSVEGVQTGRTDCSKLNEANHGKEANGIQDN